MTWTELQHFVNRWTHARSGGAETGNGGPPNLLWPIGPCTAIMRIDGEGIVRIAATGRAFEPIIARDQLLGQPWETTIPDPLRSTLRCAIDDALACQGPVPYRYRWRRGTQERLRIGWVAPGPVRGVTVVVRDFGIVPPRASTNPR